MSERFMKNKVAFRTDGNPTIGLGHVTRCLSIAQAVKKLGYETVFLISDSFACELLEENQIDFKILNVDYRKIDEDIDLMQEFVNENHIDTILVDSYFASDQYLENLMSFAHVASIDGLYKYESDVDLIINYNAAASLSYYENKFYGKHTKLLIGNKFVPLKPEYWNIENVRESKIGNKVLLTTGATDSLNVCGNILSECEHTGLLEKLDITVIIGPFFQHEEDLFNDWGQQQNIHFIRNCNNLMPLMREASIAVSAAGTTIYELLRMEIPTILFAMTDIQCTVKALSDKVEWIGDIRKRDQNDVMCIDKLEQIVDKIQKLCFCEDEYIKIKKSCQGYIDGQGAIRIADALVRI